jgi:hypothetical protein
MEIHDASTIYRWSTFILVTKNEIPRKKNVGAILAVLVARGKSQNSKLTHEKNWGSRTVKFRNHGILHVATMWINVRN